MVLQYKKAKPRQQSLEPSSMEDDASLVALHPRGTASTYSEYSDGPNRLLILPVYQPLCLDNLAPNDQYECEKWFAALSLPFSAMLYRYAYGSNLGTLSYLWRSLPKDEPIDNTAVSCIFPELCLQQSFYFTCAMRQDYVSKYSKLANTSMMILCNIYRTFSHNSSAPQCASEVQVNKCVAKAVFYI